MFERGGCPGGVAVDRLRLLGIVGCGVLAMGGLPAMAGPSEPLPAISVTATRSETTVADVAASIDSKRHDEIRLDDPVVQEDLFNSLAGVRITQTGSTIGHMTGIRMPVNTGPYYLFLQDSLPVQSSGFFNHNGLAYTNYLLAGSAEVLKGAGTALYGSDAVAATVNVLSPDTVRDRGGAVRADVGSDGMWSVGGRGRFDLGEQSDLGLGLVHQHSDGWREHTCNDRDELTIRLFHALSDDSSLNTVLSYNRTEAEMAGSLIGRAALEGDRRSVGDIAGTLGRGVEIERRFDFARLSTEWVDEGEPGLTKSVIVYLRMNRNRYTATWQPSLPQNDSRTHTVGVLAKADVRRAGWRAIAGLDLEYTRDDEHYRQAFDFVPSGHGSPVAKGDIYDYKVDYRAFAPYARLEYRPVPEITAGVGLRYDVDAFDYTNRVPDGRYDGSSFLRPDSGNDPTFHHLSPKLDVAYRLSGRSRLYVRYANGFRIPQASRLYRLRTNNIGFSLGPETTDTYEAGGHLRWRGQSVDLAVYRMSIDDTIVRRENALKERFYVNGGRTLHYGLEATIDSRWSDEWSTRLAFSHSRHRFEADDSFGDNAQRSAPGSTADLRIVYRPSWFDVVAMLEWQHVGAWWMDDGNTKRYEGYDLAAVKLSYSPRKDLDLLFRIENLTDAVYAERAEISFGKEKYTPGSPRRFFLGLRYRMG